ncbi:hypothetical protein KEM52_001687 [Ascosphaera acerosa]|nr:hypothetical protein KEM52_001687 [Ascosphaera acerosa]
MTGDENEGPGCSTADAATHQHKLAQALLTSALSSSDGGGGGSEDKTWKAQRLSRAIDRTEVFSQEKAYRFFSRTASQPGSDAPPVCPAMPVASGSAVLPSLADAPARDRAALSGVLGDCLATHDPRVPDRLVAWLLASVAHEPRDLLRQCYCAALRKAAAPRVAAAVAPAVVEDMFRRLGARPAALAVERPMAPTVDGGGAAEPSGGCAATHPAQPAQTSHHSRLLSVLSALEVVAGKLAAEPRALACKLVFRLAVDEQAMGLPAVRVHVQRAIGALLPTTPEHRGSPSLASWLFSTVRPAEFQALVLRAIPAHQPQSHVARFRCRLACAYLFDDEACLTRPLEEVADMPRITALLRRDRRFATSRHRSDLQISRGGSPHSSDTESTVTAPSLPPVEDYHQLAALAQILSYAIDAGRARPGPAATVQAAEAAFNAQADALAAAIKAVFTNILDSGASHLKRLEAKERLQMLYYRVLYGVRTRPVQKQSLFIRDREKATVQASRDVMANFLRRDGATT